MRIKLLSPAEILSRLGDYFSFLKTNYLDLPPRQRSLTVTLDWSYDLLTNPEKKVFSSLSVFGGGCTLAAAETIIGCVVEMGVEDVLAALLEKNLILRHRPNQGHARITVLKTIRDYAENKLSQGDYEGVVRRCHASYYLELAHEAECELRGPDQILWLDRLEREHENLRGALNWALSVGDDEIALDLTGSLARFWELHSHLEEGKHWLEKALLANETTNDPGAPANNLKILRAKALRGASAIAQNQGALEKAREWGQESLALWRELGDKQGQAGAYHTLGLIAQGQHHLAQAEKYHQSCLSLARELQDEVRIYISLYNLAEIAATHQDYAAAEKLHLDSLALKEKHGDIWSISWSKFCLGKLAGYRGDWRTAIRLHRESLQMRQKIGDKEAIAESLVGFAYIVSKIGHPEEAIRLLGGAEKLLKVSGSIWSPHVGDLVERCLAAVEKHVERDKISNNLTEGRAYPEAEVLVNLASALENLSIPSS